MSNQDTDLFSAVQNRDILSVIRLCPRHWGDRNDAGLTALHLAVRGSFFLAIKVLRAYEARLRLPNGRTALMEAIVRRSIRSILLLRRAEKRCQDKNGTTALMLAASMGYYKAVHILAPLESGLRDARGLTALMHATIANSVPCVKALLHHEAKQVDLQGRSALIYAVIYGCSAVVPLLLKMEAGLQDKKGNTAFIYACRSNSVSMVSQLYPHERTVVNKKQQTGLINAAMTHSIDAVSFIVTKEKSCLRSSTNSRLLEPLKQPRQFCERRGSTPKLCPNQIALCYKYTSIISIIGHTALTFIIKVTVFLLRGLRDVQDGMLRCFPMLYLTIASLIYTYFLPIYVDFYRFIVLMQQDIKFLLTNRVEIRLESNEIYSTTITLETNNIYTRGKQNIKLSSGTGGSTTLLRLQDVYGFTALMYACKAKNLHIIKALVPYESGIQTPNGECALSIALKNTDEIPSALVDEESCLYDNDLKRPCEVAFENGYTTLGRMLVDYVVNPHMTNISHCYNIRSAFLKMEKSFDLLINNPSYIDCIDNIINLKENMYNAIFDSIDSLEHDIDVCLDSLDTFFDENICVICYDNLATAISLPCKHFVLCSECSTKLSKCPMCMTLIESYIFI